MKRFLKTLCLVLAVAILALSFAGCGKKQEEDSSIVMEDSFEQLSKEHKELKNPEELTDSEEFLKEYEKFSKLIVRVSDKVYDNPQFKDVVDLFTTMNDEERTLWSECAYNLSEEMEEAAKDEFEDKIMELEVIIDDGVYGGEVALRKLKIEEIAKTHTPGEVEKAEANMIDLVSRCEALGSPESCTSADFYITQFSAYVDLYEQACKLVCEYPESDVIIDEFNKIDDVATDWHMRSSDLNPEDPVARIDFLKATIALADRIITARQSANEWLL